MLRDGARCGYYLDQARSERPTSEGMSIIRPREKLRDMSRNSFFKLQRNSITHTIAATPSGQSSTLANAHMRESVNAALHNVILAVNVSGAGQSLRREFSNE